MQNESNNLKLLKDLTERLNLRDAAIIESEKQFRGFFENSSAGMCIANCKTGYFIKVNQALCDWLGYTEKELTSIPMVDLVMESTIEKTEKVIDRLAKGEIDQTIKDFINEYRHKNGSGVWLKWNASVPNKEGINYSVCANITKELEQEKIIFQQNEQFIEFFENSAVGMVMFDHTKRKFIRVNEKFCQMIGRTKEEILNGNILDFLAKNQPSTEVTLKILDSLEKDASKYAVTQFVNAYEKPNGEIVYISWTSNSMMNHSIQSSVAVDITDEVLKKKEAQINEKIYQEILHTTDELVKVYRVKSYTEFETVYISPSHEKHTGYTVEEHLNLTPFEMIHPEDINNLMQTVQKAIITQNRQEIHYRGTRKDKTEKHVQGILVPIVSNDGLVTHLVLSSRIINTP